MLIRHQPHCAVYTVTERRTEGLSASQWRCAQL
jgi:hypothetical protein